MADHVPVPSPLHFGDDTSENGKLFLRVRAIRRVFCACKMREYARRFYVEILQEANNARHVGRKKPCLCMPVSIFIWMAGRRLSVPTTLSASMVDTVSMMCC